MQSRPTSEPEPPVEAESRWGGPRTVLALVLLGAAALRLVAIRSGLPDGEVLNAGEAEVVPRAWELTHGGGLDPHPYFDHPTLFLYLLAPFESWHDSPSFLTGRIVSLVAGLAGVAAAWWLAQRAFGFVAGGVAAVVVGVAGVHVASSRIAIPDILLTTLVTVVLGLLLTGRIEAAGAVAGLALAIEWPGALLIAPILAAGWGRWRRLARAGGLALGAFAVASPFALVHPAEAASDLWRGLSRVAVDPAPVAHVEVLWHSIGPVLVVAVVGLLVALVRRERADVVLASFALAWALALIPVAADSDAYVLPLVPVLAVLASRFVALAPVTLLLLIVPFTWTVRDTRDLTRLPASVNPPAARVQLPSRE